MVDGILDSAIGFAKENSRAIAIGGGALALGAGIATAAVIGSRRKKKARRSRKKIKHTKRGWKQDRKRRSKEKWEVAYRKRKRKAHRGSKRRGKVYYARKTGQPYIILSNGRAKFIKGKRRHR